MLHKIKQIGKLFFYPVSSMRLYLNEFSRSFLLNKKSKQTQLETMILITIHSLEKGMGIRNTREGYGQAKAKKAISYLENYITNGYSSSSFAFLEGIGVLKEYIAFNRKHGVDLKEINDRLEKLIISVPFQNVDFLKCGCNLIKEEELIQAAQFNFDSFVSSRHSIRDFDEKLVDQEKIVEAIRIANKAPSACNRQPIKVYCTKTLEQAGLVDELITGTTGFKGNIHNFSLITSDRAAFVGNEQFQWYVNGGIYLSYLMLAFHSLGIGCCTMQWFPFYKTEKQLKKMFGINKSEAIIAVLGFGYYQSENKCICAQRKNVNDTLIFMEDKET